MANSKIQRVGVPSAEAIEQAITGYAAQGFVVVSKTTTSATLQRAKEFKIVWAVIGFFLCVLPFFIYLIVYATQPDYEIIEIKVVESAAALSPGTSGAAAWVLPAVEEGPGIEENVAGLLCYILGWVSGLVFFLIDKRPSVRFHAMQSIILFGAIFLLQLIFVWGGLFNSLLGFGFTNLLTSLLGLVTLVCWVLCMVKAAQGQRFKLPVIGDIAENLSK